MLSPGTGSTIIKSKLISRRMFLLTAAKAVVMVGIVGRLISLQINQSNKYKSCLIISFMISRPVHLINTGAK